MMDTIALRFGEHFAPACGTIAAHKELIDKNGFVWYGKMGSQLADKIIDMILKNDNPKILLIQSGKTGRFWAYVTEISKTTPPKDYIPEYYRDNASKFSCWFKIIKFEMA